MLSPDTPLDLADEDLKHATSVLQGKPVAGDANDPPFQLLLDLLRTLDEARANQNPAGRRLPLPTLGIFGSWGTGKSTVLRWCEQVLSAAGWPVIRFEAWRHQGDSDPMVALLEELHEWAKEHSATPALRSRITRFLKRWEQVLLAGVLSTFRVISKVATGLDLADPLEAVAKAAQAAPSILSEYRRLRRELRRIVEDVRRVAASVHQEKKKSEGSGEQEDKAANLPPLVILVDDLDRCLPDRAWSILETLRVHFLAPDVACILALEPDILASHIERVYGARLGAENRPVVDGQRFLDRVVSHGYQLRPLKFSDVQQRLQGYRHLFGAPVIIEALGATDAFGNASWVPRIWVQLLNQLDGIATMRSCALNAGQPIPPDLAVEALLHVFRDCAKPLSNVKLADITQRLGPGGSVGIEELFRYEKDRWAGEPRLRTLQEVLRGLGVKCRSRRR